MKMKQPDDADGLKALCEKARALMNNREFSECEQLICAAIGRYPHKPEPNNLLGILLEMQGDHILAMKHFRAAWALDAAYRPARQNLERFGSFFPRETIAFDENDCPADPMTERFDIEYDARSIGHAVRKKSAGA